LVAKLASEVISKLGGSDVFHPKEILVNDDYCMPGYGVLTDLEVNALRMFAREEGLLLDPVYTGRAAGGLIDLLQKGFFSSDATVLFWHTGGTPALFAHRYQSILSKI
jgi:D-cysteine desulfhydrase